MYKSQLQEYAQKSGLMPPTYDHVKEGAPHEPRFKSTVCLNSISYESAPGFQTVRSAEHAAAKVALDSLHGVAHSSVHESGLCKNLLQEFAQKHGYSLPQYKIVRSGQEHSLNFAATVDIAGVSYSGGAAKSKKEAEIKAARTALLAIQATQPAGKGPLEPESPVAPAQPQQQPGPVANFVKCYPKRKKRGRVNPSLTEEPLATRMKQGLGYVAGPMQPPQIYQIPQIPQVSQIPPVSQIPQVLQFPQVSQYPQVSQISLPPVNQVAQVYPVNTVGYSGETVMPVQWNPELGVCTRPVFSEPMQVGQVVSQDIAMTKPGIGSVPAVVQGSVPTPITNVLPVGNKTAGTPQNLDPKAAALPIEPSQGVEVVAQNTALSGKKETEAAVVVSDGVATPNPTDLQEPMQGGKVVAKDTAVTKSELETISATVQETAPIPNSNGKSVAGANGTRAKVEVVTSGSTDT